MASEALAGLLGFLVTVHFARRLHPAAFGQLEFASVLVSWLLVFVRSGVEQVIYREAARRPRLIVPFTELLTGVRCVGALVGLAVVALASLRFSTGGAPILLLSGLLLLPSTILPDVEPRARGRLSILAVSQALRSLTLAAVGLSLVRRPSDIHVAVVALVVSEFVGNMPLLVRYVRTYGCLRPRFRRRAWSVFVQRGTMASLIRFLRVGLYAGDVVVLGMLASDDLGSYGAARRVVFALVALGLVIPAAFGPVLGRAWAGGPSLAHDVLARGLQLLMSAALPAMLGLALTSQRWMPLFFGAEFPTGALLLVLIGLRLPLLLVVSFVQSAFVAFRRESSALALASEMGVLGLVTIPLAAIWAGAPGAALAMVAIEAFGTVIGWVGLVRLNVAPNVCQLLVPPVAGLIPMVFTCVATSHLPLWFQCGASATSYAAAWWLARLFSSQPLTPTEAPREPSRRPHSVAMRLRGSGPYKGEPRP
jgi:O-antigen/teichoic acid export membrane protein